MKYYNILNILISLPFLLLSICQSDHGDCQSHKNGTEEVIAIVDNQCIYNNQLDSLMYEQIYEIQMRTVNFLISQKLLETEAHQRGITKDELINQMIKSKASVVRHSDIMNYINNNALTYVDTVKIYEYLTSLNTNYRQLEYVDSLKLAHDVSINILPKYLKEIKTNDLFSLNFNKPIKAYLTVQIISSFECPACQKIQPKLKNIMHTYNKIIQFQFIYFSDYIDNDALACTAAAQQGKFYEMYDLLTITPNNHYNDSLLNEIAIAAGLNMKSFNLAIKNDSDLKKIISTKDILIDEGIYSTPVFIINGKLYNDPNAIFYIESLLKHEIKNIGHGI
jgi:protein-disulfide isomerase